MSLVLYWLHRLIFVRFFLLQNMSTVDWLSKRIQSHGRWPSLTICPLVGCTCVYELKSNFHCVHLVAGCTCRVIELESNLHCFAGILYSIWWNAPVTSDVVIHHDPVPYMALQNSSSAFMWLVAVVLMMIRLLVLMSGRYSRLSWSSRKSSKVSKNISLSAFPSFFCISPSDTLSLSWHFFGVVVSFLVEAMKGDALLVPCHLAECSVSFMLPMQL